MVGTPNGDIYYEYLSSGFKSCLSIIFGIIKDIEYRLKEPGVKVDEFDGVVLIDELELHLHPEWQARMSRILVEVFPNVQFIASTHSPHIIQAANPEEIIALESDGDQIYRRELPSSKYGFQGWTVEEVLVDVMGMTDIRTNAYKESILNFEKSIDQDDYEAAAVAYKELEISLHPDNHLRKLLKFQLMSVKGESNDQTR